MEFNLSEIEFPRLLEPIRFGADLPEMEAGDVQLVTDPDASCCLVNKLRSGGFLIRYMEEDCKQMSDRVNEYYKLDAIVMLYRPFTLDLLESRTVLKQ